ncbi:MAG: metal ABC transporter permease [Gammaproteobacteria bacterium]|nr:metal ABC transporter permease [Gammaproteobacteria bacterium]
MSIFLYSIVFILGLSLLSGPIGSLMLWRQMTFFGETVAHGTLLAFLLQYVTHWPLIGCMIIIVLAYCIVLEIFESNYFDLNQVFPLLSYGAMGCALLLTETVVRQPRMIYRVLIGDILLVSYDDCLILFILLLSTICFVSYYYRAILLSLFSADLARLRYRSIFIIRFVINVLIGLSVAMSVQSAGMLLAMAVLTIPSLTAASWSKHPWSMILLSSGVALVGSFLGFAVSMICNWPTGPTITVMLLVLYCLSVCVQYVWKSLQI